MNARIKDSFINKNVYNNAQVVLFQIKMDYAQVK
jgi:hypothetical protein